MEKMSNAFVIYKMEIKLVRLPLRVIVISTITLTFRYHWQIQNGIKLQKIISTNIIGKVKQECFWKDIFREDKKLLKWDRHSVVCIQYSSNHGYFEMCRKQTSLKSWITHAKSGIFKLWYSSVWFQKVTHYFPFAAYCLLVASIKLVNNLQSNRTSFVP